MYPLYNPLIFKLKLQAFEPLNMTSVVSWEHHADFRGWNNSWKHVGSIAFLDVGPTIFRADIFVRRPADIFVRRADVVLNTGSVL